VFLCSELYALRVPMNGHKKVEEALKEILVNLSIDQLIREAELSMPFCDEKNQDWTKFNIIVKELRKRQDVSITVLAGDDFENRGRVDVDKYTTAWIRDMDNHQQAFLAFSLQNVLHQHVKSGIALAIIQEITIKKENKYIKISIIDNGTGPIYKNGKRASIEEILEYGREVGMNSKVGIGLSSAVRDHADLATIHIPGNSVVIRERIRKKPSSDISPQNIIWRGKNKKTHGMTVIGYFYDTANIEDVKEDVISRAVDYIEYKKLSALDKSLALNQGVEIVYGDVDMGTSEAKKRIVEILKIDHKNIGEENEACFRNRVECIQRNLMKLIYLTDVEGKKPVGYILYEPKEGNLAHFRRIFIKEEYRQKGLFGLLVKFSMDKFDGIIMNIIPDEYEAGYIDNAVIEKTKNLTNMCYSLGFKKMVTGEFCWIKSGSNNKLVIEGKIEGIEKSKSLPYNPYKSLLNTLPYVAPNRDL